MVISLILPCTGYGAFYYVAVNGNDNNPGTELNPFRTIQRAADIVQPGDTVNVGQGVYREIVVLKTSGTKANPISFKTDPTSRATITGAEAVMGWQLLDANENIYYADVPGVPDLPKWMRRRFFQEDGKSLTLARVPKEGWWLTEDAGPNTLIDTVHLAQFTEPNDLIGAEVFYQNVIGCFDFIRIITGFNPDTKELTFDNTTDYPTPGKDYYYLRNKLNLLTQPGEWVLDTNREIPRFYVRPSDDGEVDNHIYEYSQEGPIILLNSKSYITIQGFEIRDGLFYGIYGYADGFQLLNCHLTGNAYIAVSVRGKDIVIKDNVLENNSFGVSVYSAENVLVKHNHIFNGYNDGLVLSWDVNNATIVDNFIHDHILWGHPDNLQFHNGVNNVTIERNVLLNSGQSMMLSKTSAGQIINNLIVGSSAYSVILEHTAYPYKIIGNTIGLTGYGPIGVIEPNGLSEPLREGFAFDHEFKNNILYPGHSGIYSFTWQDPNVYTNYNLLYQTDTGGRFGGYEDTWLKDLNEWQSISGLDANSKDDNPLFVNVPAYFLSSVYPYLCTRNKLYVRDYAEYIDIGDHIETNFDGIDRIVVNEGNEPYTDNNGNPITIYYIEIEPALQKKIDTDIAIANWKASQVCELDFRLQRLADGYSQDSPALGMAEDSSDVGYEVDLPALRRSDFDGDSITDDPRYRALAGDVDNDRDVDFIDFAIFSLYWQKRNAPVPGDLNDNKKVDFMDFAVLAAHWQEEGCSEPEWCYGSDLDRSSVVDLGDLSVLAEHWLEGHGGIPGDLDKDGDIDLADLALFAEDWLQTTIWH